MKTQAQTGVDDSRPTGGVVPWRSLEKQRASAFMLAGSLMVASFIVPVGLSSVTDWAWASGILLVGLAVVAVAVGLFGLYPQINERASRVAFTGAIFAGIAGIAALSLIAVLGIVLVAEIGLSMSISKPMDFFVMVALSMAGGFSLGFLLFGVAARRSDGLSRSVGQLLVVGGLLLLAPVIVEILGLVYSVTTPPWVLFPILGVVALDTLTVGYVLSGGETE